MQKLVRKLNGLKEINYFASFHFTNKIIVNILQYIVEKHLIKVIKPTHTQVSRSYQNASVASRCHLLDGERESEALRRAESSN